MTLGCRPNVKRGGGSYFGPDISTNLLSNLNFGLLIRSHECCPNGWKFDHHNKVAIIVQFKFCELSDKIYTSDLYRSHRNHCA